MKLSKFMLTMLMQSRGIITKWLLHQSTNQQQKEEKKKKETVALLQENYTYNIVTFMIIILTREISKSFFFRPCNCMYDLVSNGALGIVQNTKIDSSSTDCINTFNISN